MDNRTQSLIILLALVAVGLFLGKTLVTYWSGTAFEGWIAPGDVRGIAVIEEGTAYTLNFDQQEEVLRHINRAVWVGHAPKSAGAVQRDIHMEIYRFNNKPPLTLQPIARTDEALFYSVSPSIRSGVLRDTSWGQLSTVVTSAIAP